MPWAQFDDHFHDSEAALRAGPEACGLHLLATTWCSAHLSDGALPEVAARPLIDRCSNGDDLVARLLEVNLWATADDGFAIVGFLDANRSKAEVDRDRAIRKAAGAAGGRARARNAQHSS